MDYSKTVNLPKTEFPMKADLPHREPEIQQFWDEIGLYRKTQEKPAPRGKFVLHDGPPYSNGDVHVGNTMQNKLPKDFIVKFKTMRGFRAPYVPGWDNHGMPIENNVTAEFRKAGKHPEKIELRRRCREYASHWVDVQRKQYKRLGIGGDWENPYLTMSKDFEAMIVQVFAELAKQGYIYRGLRPIHWCCHDETALAEAELEYRDHESPSIFVRFPLVRDPNGVFGEHPADHNYAVIWTTTPWTIPANLALAVHPDYDYNVVDVGQDRYLLASDLLEHTMASIGVRDYRIAGRLAGRKLEGLVFRHPIFERDSPVVLADYVTLSEGTGVVHTAPGHGREDFLTGQQYGLEILSPVDERGHFTEEAGQFAGMSIKRGDTAVVEALADRGALLAQSMLKHSYPHCWRCHDPVIFRATVQWFLDMDHNNLRQSELEAIESVQWLPQDSYNRIKATMESAPDWCLSRQRAWGVGIPVFYCEGCGAEMMTDESFGAVIKLLQAEGSDAWFEKPAAEILPKGFKCPDCGGSRFTKETDVLDVWFDSGSTCRAVVEARPELGFPADLYLEGYDQFRGWFGKSLNIAMATRGAPPYRAVAAHGFGVDAQGFAMHKSRGNVIRTTDVTTKYGADVVRLTSSSFNLFSDARLSEEVLQRATDAYRRLRNTFRFLLGNLYDFDPERHRVARDDMLEIDRWIMHRLQQVIQEITAGYEEYEFHRVFHTAHNFAAVDLSAIYLDIIKDRLYASAPDDPMRRSAQTALYEILSTMVRALAPVLAHTAEEVWRYLPGEGKALSVHLADFPEVKHEFQDEELAARWQRLFDLRDEVYRTIEQARQSGVIGKPLESRVRISAPPALYDFLSENVSNDLPSVLIVSQVVLERAPEGQPLSVEVEPPEGRKCERCWLVLETVGGDAKHPTLCARCAEVVSGIV
jgi:isoleucyl-tRNA synthetase